MLKEASGGKAKVFGLSLKDRSAILPTGRRPDGAYWFYSGVFGTSTYYADGVHPWVAEFNRSKFADRWFARSGAAFVSNWITARWSGPDDAAGEGKGIGHGVAFPHPITGGKSRVSSKYYDARRFAVR